MNDGGPAFPVVGAPGAKEDYPGMTLRDYFAAKAMYGVISGQEHRGSEPIIEAVAEHAYNIADAMLAERSRKEGGGAS